MQKTMLVLYLLLGACPSTNAGTVVAKVESQSYERSEPGASLEGKTPEILLPKTEHQSSPGGRRLARQDVEHFSRWEKRLQRRRRYPPPTRQEVLHALDTAPSVELLSIKPVRFESWVRTGSVRLGGEEKAELVNALEQGIRKSNGLSACFKPRHGLVVRTPEACYFLIICFHCHQIYAVQVEPGSPLDVEAEHGHELRMETDESPLKIFDRAVEKHHLDSPQ